MSFIVYKRSQDEKQSPSRTKNLLGKVQCPSFDDLFVVCLYGIVLVCCGLYFLRIPREGYFPVTYKT